MQLLLFMKQELPRREGVWHRTYFADSSVGFLVNSGQQEDGTDRRVIIQAEPIAHPCRMEHFFACPYCVEEISMVLDTSVKGQTYVEDCEVCCHPIEVRYTVEDGAVSHFEARRLE